jgi:hypothetical protein
MTKFGGEGDPTTVDPSATIWRKPYTTSSPIEQRRSALNANAIRAELRGDPDSTIEAYSKLADYDLRHKTGDNAPCEGRIQTPSSLSS